MDGNIQPDILAIVGARRVSISDIPYGIPPYEGPIGAVRIGMIEGDFVVNPLLKKWPNPSLIYVLLAHAMQY
ncbi:MAG: hypothetical protein CM1200mP6_02650 [Anaerolineaceae bacterium]|nr:MAG: hypothetical protein CM1200mP6_02650 [Anaerolineaceae bacterium]